MVGGDLINRLGLLVDSYPFTYINLHTIWVQTDTNVYRFNDMAADEAL